MRILGIDPGLKITGYGVIDSDPFRPKLVDGGVIKLNPRSPVAQRLVELETELDSIIEEFKPDVCAVEKLYGHYERPLTAVIMAHARGVILLAAQKRGLVIEQFPSNRVKQAVAGHGHAKKIQMQRAIQSLLNLKDLPSPPDVADALAVAICCGRHIATRRALRA